MRVEKVQDRCDAQRVRGIDQRKVAACRRHLSLGETDGLEATLISQLTGKSTAAGVVGTTAGTHIYGPYLRRGFPPAPVGPNIGASGVLMSTAADLTTVIAEASTTIGWIYNYQTGDIIINTDDTDESTAAYSSY